MENAGAITFRDSELLVADNVTSLIERVGVISVLAHETAHQWFGDLVTMRWWNDLWLNEGFATFLATKTMRIVHPELEPDLNAVRRIDSVMRLDGLASARRVTARRVSTRRVRTPELDRRRRLRPSRRPSRPSSRTRSATWAPVVRRSSMVTRHVAVLDRVAVSPSKPVLFGPRDRAARASCFFVAWSQ